MDELLRWFQSQNASARTYASFADRAFSMIGAGHADAAALRLLGDQAMRFFLKFQDEPLSAEEGVRAFEMMTNMLQRATGLQGLAAAEQLKILNEIARTDLSTTEA